MDPFSGAGQETVSPNKELVGIDKGNNGELMEMEEGESNVTQTLGSTTAEACSGGLQIAWKEASTTTTVRSPSLRRGRSRRFSFLLVGS